MPAQAAGDAGGGDLSVWQPSGGRLLMGGPVVAAVGEHQVCFGEQLEAYEGPLWSSDACGLFTAAKWQDGVVCVAFRLCMCSAAVRTFGSGLCHGVRGTAVSCLVPWACSAAELWPSEHSCFCPPLQGHATAQVNPLQVRKDFELIVPHTHVY